jgi:hypothetical protein
MISSQQYSFLKKNSKIELKMQGLIKGFVKGSATPLFLLAYSIQLHQNFFPISSRVFLYNWILVFFTFYFVFVPNSDILKSTRGRKLHR